MDWFPILSQVKSLIQFASGDREAAEQTQKNFINQCPVVSQVKSLVHATQGDIPAAQETQKCFLKTLSGVADGIPVVGHIKGGIHYAMKDKEAGDDSMKAASRTVGVIGGGVAGFLVGGPLGSAIGGISGGSAMDAITTAIDSAVHKEYRPAGSLVFVEKIKEDVDKKQFHKIGADVFELGVMIAGDAITGKVAGNAIGKKIVAYQELNKANGPDLVRNFEKTQQRSALMAQLEEINRAAEKGPIPKSLRVAKHNLQKQIGQISREASQKIGPNRVHTLIKDRLGEVAVDTSNNGRMIYKIEGVQKGGTGLNLKFKEFLPGHNYDNPGPIRGFGPDVGKLVRESTRLRPGKVIKGNGNKKREASRFEVINERVDLEGKLKEYAVDDIRFIH